MIGTNHLGSIAATTLLLTFSTAIALAENASSGNAVAAAATSVRTRQTLVALEKNAYEAWKARSADYWDTVLSDQFVGWGASGRLDKASAADEYSGADCTIASYDLSDVRVTPRGRDAALITY